MLTLVEQIKDAVKDAMRARDKARLAALRLITAEFKRIEVDERIEVDDARALAVLDKMVKQRLDSEAQYRAAGRDELAEVEAFEIRVIREYLPAPLSDDELDALIKQTVVTLGASSMAQMGAVMGQLKGQVAGRADMGVLSAKVKALLAAS
ncbi:MAG: GatB/YqeY domain-containing protein [Pseudomonadales bacterium]|nr:GatB/YqeY domain-containing protein [Pseudomonadales bacterium]MBL6808815.1 GatB/YqeY domain-containing protein [Pseudomonadales bacterium]